ncbi:hypothetical protein NPIL_191921 [Nephila pilipes]|uniref:Uncharacterized protein n=1 Tax=Nephila pilipes TaxID=299642 RepID=A0A8X6PCV0_NEPPI|nr:hypothetical protein NPIL_191921 [Nephila pilipes]
MIVAVYECSINMESGPIQHQLWNAPRRYNEASIMTAQHYVDHMVRSVTISYLQNILDTFLGDPIFLQAHKNSSDCHLYLLPEPLLSSP